MQIKDVMHLLHKYTNFCNAHHHYSSLGSLQSQGDFFSPLAVIFIWQRDSVVTHNLSTVHLAIHPMSARVGSSPLVALNWIL